MIVAFFGDTHGNIDLMFAKALAWEERTGTNLDLLIQIGDFGVWPNHASVDDMSRRHSEKAGEDPIGDFRKYAIGQVDCPRPLYFIRGNHEAQQFLRAHQQLHMMLYPEDYLTRAVPICRNMFYIPDGHIVTLGGIRFAAWGGNFSSRTWKNGLEYWDPQLSGRRLNHMTRDAFERLIREKYDVLLTHDAPVGSGVSGDPRIKLPADEMSGNGCAPIRQLIDEVQPRYQINGHWHQYRKNQFGRTTAYVLDKVAPKEPDAQCMEVLELDPQLLGR